MAGNAVTDLVKGQGAPIEQRPILRGYISTGRPAPESFTDQVWVIAPGYSIDRPLGPCEWGAIHGAAMPAQGAEVVVSVDDKGIPTIVWWQGPQTSTTLPTVSTLPGEPVDGQEIVFQTTAMATGGVIWRFRYNAESASTHKWELQGGSALFTAPSGGGSLATASVAFSATSSVVGLTIPLAGEYELEFGARAYPFAQNQTMLVVPALSVGEASEASALEIDAAASVGNTGSRKLLASTVSAGQVFTLYYKKSSSIAEAEFSRRWLSALPIRVG
jgi:hypothetical protein